MELLSMRTFYLLLTLSFIINTTLAQHSLVPESPQAVASRTTFKRIDTDSYFLSQKKSTIETLYTKPQIRLQSLKRFAATIYADTLTYNIQITFIANFSTHIVTLKRPGENETVHFEYEHLIDFEHPDKYGRLTVIATVREENNKVKGLLGILDFDKEKNYGTGIQKLILMKEVTISSPRNGPIAKKAEALKVLVPCYELTFEIKFNSLK